MNYLFILFLLIAVVGCEQKSQVRHYTEVAVEAPAASVSSMDPHAGLDMGQDPHAGLDMPSAPMMATANVDVKSSLTWKVPEGWVEEPAKGLRLASFRDVARAQDIDVSIVPLGGSIAGGLESNLKRWLGQINVQVSQAQLQSFIQSSLDNIFDFSQLQKGQNPATKSMMVTIISLPEMTTFVKMTGDIKAISRNKVKFMDLVKSIHSKPESQGQSSQDETSIKDPHAGLDMSTSSTMLPTGNSVMEGHLTLKLPTGWEEQPVGGMRLATFRLASDPQKIDCSIVVLGGMAGGLEANLSRWMGQIGLKRSSESLQSLIHSSKSLKTQDGQEAKIYDFTTIQKDTATSDKSMIAAIISSAEVTIFVKMTGSIEAVSQNRNDFSELVKSLHHQ